MLLIKLFNFLIITTLVMENIHFTSVFSLALVLYSSTFTFSRYFNFKFYF